MRTEPLNIHLYDTSIQLRQDTVWDETFKTDVYGGLIRQLRDRGWSVHEDPEVRKNYPTLSGKNRLAAKGTLRAKIETAGRRCEIEFWGTTSKQENRAGRRYEFDKFESMNYLDQKRFLLEAQRITDWAATIAQVSVNDRRKALKRNQSALDRIQEGYDASVHTNKELGRPVCSSDYNRESADGALIEHGQTVWFRDRAGYLKRGQALYNINSMWWVVFGPKEYTNLTCREILTACPDLTPRVISERTRRRRLEGELRKALEQGRYDRAALLDHLILGGEETHFIWSRDKQAYYGSQYSGYTSDRFNAGRYTRAEAEKECRRVPHILSMVRANGEHVRFDQEKAA